MVTQAETNCPSLCVFIKSNLAGHSPEVRSLEMFSFVRNDKHVLSEIVEKTCLPWKKIYLADEHMSSQDKLII